MSTDSSASSVGAAPLRVAHLNSRLTGGGTDDQCVKQAWGLHRLRQGVTIAGPDDREVSGVVRDLGVPLHPTGEEGWLKLRLILALARWVRRQRIQVIHGHHGCDLWPTVLAAHLSGVRPRVVLTRHMAKSPSSWFSRGVLLNRCDAMVAVSEFVARVLREGVYESGARERERRARPPMRGDLSRIRVVHGGIDTDRFRPLPRGDGAVREQRAEWGLGPGDYAFAVVGGYDLPRGKGQREFLQAARSVLERVPHARFLMVGRGSMAEVLRADIERLGLTGKAALTGYCRDMPVAMNALDCLVHPQVGTEAFGLVVVEALACGTAVVASALDGIPEAFPVGAPGRLVAPENVPELADAMVAQARQPRPDAAACAVLHGRVSAEYSVDSMSRKYLQLYRELLNCL